MFLKERGKASSVFFALHNEYQFRMLQVIRRSDPKNLADLFYVSCRCGLVVVNQNIRLYAGSVDE